MPKTIHFAPLGSSDAPQIRRLQHRLFPRPLRESLDEIRGILRNTERHLACNLSFGLFDGARMVGYVFAYVEDRSIFHERSEEVVYLKEIALLPGYESSLLSVTGKLYEQWSVFTPNVALEAHAEANAAEKWQKLARLFQRLGLTVAIREEAPQQGRPRYLVLRIDVSHETLGRATKAAPLRTAQWDGGDGTSVTLVTDAREWLSLRDDWQRLLADTDDGNVFQSFDYLWQWWRCFGIWNELRVVVIRRGESVLGVVPLMQEYFSVFGRVARKLMFMTAPMEMNRPKFIFGKDGDICLSAFLAWLADDFQDWDIFDIDEQLVDDTKALRRHFSSTGCLVAESSTLCPYLEFDGTWEQFLVTLSRRMRSNINRLRRKLAQLGDVSVTRVASWPELREGIAVYCGIEERSWKMAKDLSLQSDKSHYFFHRGLARVFGESGNFEMRILECGGKAIAATYGIRCGNVFQSLKIAHDAAFDELSPGTLLESYELQGLIEDGLRRYEFMGSFLSNKLRWTSTVVPTTNLHVYKRQWRLMLFYFIFFVFKRRVKALLKRTGQFDRVDRLLNRLGKNPFPRY